MQIQISLLLQKPTDLDLHCLQRQGISGFRMTRVNNSNKADFDPCTIGASKQLLAFVFTKGKNQMSTRFLRLKDSIFLKNRHFLIQEKFNKLIYGINTIINSGI